MAQFIELHCKHNGNPLYVNVDTIAFIENENGRVYINFLMQRVSTRVVVMYHAMFIEKKLQKHIHRLSQK